MRKASICLAGVILSLFLMYDIYYVGGVHSLIVLGKILESVGELQISAGRHILFWKEKKIGGTTLCGVLQCHAEHESLSFMGRDEWLDTTYASGGLRNVMSFNDIVQHNVLCFHKAYQTAWPLWMAEGGHDFHQVLMFRDPLQQAVAAYYQKHVGAGVPSLKVAQTWFNEYLDSGLWFKVWGFVSSEADAEQVLDELLLGASIGSLASPRMRAAVTNVTVLSFNHYKASLCLLGHELAIHPECLELPSQNVKPHPLSTEWPQQAVTLFNQRALDLGLERIFQKAQLVFGLQYQAASELYSKQKTELNPQLQVRDASQTCLNLGAFAAFDQHRLIQSLVPKSVEHANAFATCFQQLEICSESEKVI